MATGTINSIVGRQVVVKADGSPPKIGSKAKVDGRTVGVVADVIGAVENPYFVLKPKEGADLPVGGKVNVLE